MTQEQLQSILAAAGDISEEQKKAMVCALVGHSRIQTRCFGYYYCARCSAQVGDTLASVYDGAKDAVVVGHNCETCQRNYATTTWRDRFMAPDPFAKEVQS